MDILSAPFHILILAGSPLNGGTNVGCGPVVFFFFYDTRFCSQCQHTNDGEVRTLFLGLILFLVPSDTMLYWPSPN